MSIALSLIPILGKPVAEKLIKALGERSNGTQKFEQAAAAMAQGATAIEALKKSFGQDFQTTLNTVAGVDAEDVMKYQAGTQAYIKLEEPPTKQTLKDELNINLDRLTSIKTKTPELTNMFRGLISVWHNRCNEVFSTEAQKAEIEATFVNINSLLDGEIRGYKELYKILKVTTLGGSGALMIIGGVMLATTTGVGIATTVSTIIFGVPLATVGLFVLPGVLLVLLAKRESKPMDVMSISVALLYKLLQRLGEK